MPNENFNFQPIGNQAPQQPQFHQRQQMPAQNAFDPNFFNHATPNGGNLIDPSKPIQIRGHGGEVVASANSPEEADRIIAQLSENQDPVLQSVEQIIQGLPDNYLVINTTGITTEEIAEINQILQQYV